MHICKASALFAGPGGESGMARVAYVCVLCVVCTALLRSSLPRAVSAARCFLLPNATYIELMASEPEPLFALPGRTIKTLIHYKVTKCVRARQLFTV